MSEWKKVSLSEMGIVSRGKSKHRPRNDTRLYGGRYPFIQTGDIGAAGLYVTDYSQTYNEEGLAQSKLWEKNTLCITIAANIADTALLAFPACFPDSIMGFVPHKDVANVKYVKYCFDILKKDCQQISQGTAQDNLSWKKLSTIKFPCPPLEVQNRIATILSRYDSLIENYQKQIKLLEEAAQRLYKEWFVDLHFPGHESTNIVDGVPEGWEKKSITDVLEIKYGKDHKLLKEGTIPVYGTGGIMRYVEKSLFTGESVLIPRKGSLNNIMLVGGTFWTIDTMFYSIPKENNVAKIVYFYLKGVDMYSFNIGATVPSMTVNILSGMKLLVPNEDVKNKFETIVSKYFIRIHSLQSQLRLLTEARDRLLPKLMNGEITV